MNRVQLRITHLVENLERGGLERVVIDLALEQAAMGHKIQVICLFKEGLLARELLTAGIPVFACHKRGGFDWRAVRKLRGLLMGHETQILHSHNPVSHYYGVLASAFMANLAICNTRHGMGNAPFNVRRELLYRAAMLRTSFVAMVCESARRNFIRHKIVASAKAHVVSNGIRLSLFKLLSKDGKKALMEALPLPPDALLIVSVGRLSPVKNQAMLLHALVRVRAMVSQAVLVIIGGGPLKDELETLAKTLGISNVVHFLGDRDDVKTLLPGFDLFALPSLSEGYSISLLEACASALPIVATDVGGNAEIVKPGMNGILVESGSAEAMANAIIRLADDRNLRLEMGKLGREWVAANGTIEVMAKRYMALYLGEPA